LLIWGVLIARLKKGFNLKNLINKQNGLANPKRDIKEKAKPNVGG
jgi:hypothetical protein